jgi:catechol 2,3-dioxygenase-like lactoylglutathione lyase family enzyme
MNRASARLNDRPAIRIAAPSSGGDGIAAPHMKKSPTGVTPYGFFHDCRCTVPPFRIQPLRVTKVAWHPDNIAAALQRFWGWNCKCPAARLTPKPGSSTATTIIEGETKMPTVGPKVTWDHVHLRSPDPEATATWLHDILGGEIIRGPGRIDVKLGGANVFIAPVASGDGVNSPPVTPYQGLDHFGLTVKDIDAVAAEIKAKGVEFTREPTTIRPGVRICFIRGPQGISIELLERDKKYA